jgi:hypothetical protein
VKTLHKRLRPVWLAGIALAWLLGAKVAAADEIIEIDGVDLTVSDGTVSDTTAADLDGWFSNGNTPLPFPAEPDPSQPWTSAANIATLDYWLSLVMELGDDPSLLSQLYGLGMISSPDPATAPVSQVSQESLVSQVSQVSGQGTESEVPEPVTLGLFLGGLSFLGLYAAERARRSRDEPMPAAIIVCRYGPL